MNNVTEQIVASEPAQVIVSIIPIVGIAIGGFILFFYMLWHHHEIKLQIKTGTFVPKKFNLKVFSLLAGFILTGVGLMLSLVFSIADGFTYSILGGLIPFITGVSFLLFYKINPDFHRKNDEQS